jgi:hypothetical protein
MNKETLVPIMGAFLRGHAARQDDNAQCLQVLETPDSRADFLKEHPEYVGYVEGSTREELEEELKLVAIAEGVAEAIVFVVGLLRTEA